MNEFEKTLRSIKPAEGKSDAMQLMFLAGRQSTPTTQPLNKAGAWKLATGFLTAACLLLALQLVTQSWATSRPDSEVAESKSPTLPSATGERDSSSPSVKVNSFASVHPEIDLDDPNSWHPMGPRIKQLMTATRVTGSMGTPEGKLTPFSMKRSRDSNNL